MKVAGSLSSWKNWRACRMRFSDKSMPVTRQPMRAKGTRLPPSPQPDFKNPALGSDRSESVNVGKEMKFTGRCQFLKVSLSVFVSLLHTFGCVLDSFSKKILERNKCINNNCILSEK